ncbi:MAG TPA: HEAT repeat domain-containing protein [Acidobacteriota bacterium]|nr:HEAT repeat domain-containing protein [Acidobacteriota bacterium]
MSILGGFFKPDVGKLKAKRDVKGLIRALQYQKNFVIQSDAARALGEIGDPLAVEALVEAVNNPVELVGTAALDALVKIGDDAAPSLAKQLKNKNLRLKIRDALINIGSPAIEPLIGILGEEKDVSEAAADALWEIGLASVEPLIEAMKNSGFKVRCKAAKVLGYLADLLAVQPLIEASNAPDIEFREIVFESLGRIGAPEAVETLLKALEVEESGGPRREAISALGKIGDYRAIWPIVEALEDDDEWVRWDAEYALSEFGVLAVEGLIGKLAGTNKRTLEIVMKILGKIGDSRAVQPLIDIVKTREELSVAAEEALIELGESAVEPLIGSLVCEDIPALERVIKTLGRLGNPKAVQPLMKIARGKDRIRPIAIKAVCEIADPDSADFLHEMLQVTAEDVRVSVLRALGKIGDADAVKTLIKIMDKGLKDREEVIFALGEIGNPKAIGVLLKELTDRKDFEAQAAEALGKIGDSRAVEPLINKLSDEDCDEELKRSLICALGEIGDKKATDALIDTLDGDDKYVREEAVKALGKIGGELAIHVLHELIEDKSLRFEAIHALAHMEDSRAIESLIVEFGGESYLAANTLISSENQLAVEPLIEALGNENTKIRRAAAYVLQYINGPDAVEPLTDALNDRCRKVKQHAALALGDIGDCSVVEALAGTLNDEIEEVRISSAEALGRLGDPEALDSLVEALGDDSFRVRREAAEALGKIGVADAREKLEQLQNDESEWVRKAAKEAIQAIKEKQNA